MKFKMLTGHEEPKMVFTSGSAIKAGDLVALAADDGKIDVVAADGTAALGWALNGASGADKEVTVILGYGAVLAEMPVTGDYAAGMVGGYFALAGNSGGQSIDVGDTSHDLLRLAAYDAETGKALVQVIPSAFQFGGKEVA